MVPRLARVQGTRSRPARVTSVSTRGDQGPGWAGARWPLCSGHHACPSVALGLGGEHRHSRQGGPAAKQENRQALPSPSPPGSISECHHQRHAVLNEGDALVGTAKVGVSLDPSPPALRPGGGEDRTDPKPQSQAAESKSQLCTDKLCNPG